MHFDAWWREPWLNNGLQATRPFQFAMQSRAGTDALVLSVRAALDTRENAVIVSLDGRSAYDSISRASFLAKLREVAPQLLPFARLFYGQASAYCWWDAAGNLREIRQSEGCEQGDPLAPALFALGQHESLARAAETLHPSDCLMAFLDDLYLVTVPDRCRGSLDAVTHSVAEGCGIASNLGKTRVIRAIAGAAPPRVAELGPDVWRGDKPPNQRGMVVLGSPVGHPDFIAAWTAQRMAQEQELLEHLPLLPDLQCAWLLLALCASPRANHALRTVPPPDISLYAQAHDAAMWATLLELLGGACDTTEAVLLARVVASLPAALGGLGLQSASRLAPAAYWAAWADSLPVIQARFRDMAAQLQRHLGDDDARCLAHANAARRLLITEGWGDCPNWHDITGGLLAAPHAEAGLGDWPHGWQFHASRTRNLYYRDRVLLPTLPPDHRALLRSQSGPHAGSWLAAIPGEAATTLSPEAMQVALRRRLRLPLPIASGRCGPSPGCGGPVDLLGDHALACPRTGLLARRAKVVERAWIRVARDSGTRRPHCPATMAGTQDGSPRRADRPSPPGLAHLWGDAQRDRAVLRRHARFAADANHAARMSTEPRCALPSGANGQHTRNLRPPARSASSYLGRWWEADGMVEPSVWCAIWFGSAHFEPHPPSGAPPSLAGHAGGGASCRWPRSRP